ncbi:hypothetical protein [Arthrobacter sp. B3I4]|uniref:hypothetical protein n=1 Tax=Arthrobacter sp. B3I4 TaxID=3042267 RepID=UPI0027814397|nr:hypothetical protein [Arthrobacter sp. B3I4]MDQ0755583.1 hypothetical protein [Arthrobacter sp. B3I4]
MTDTADDRPNSAGSGLSVQEGDLTSQRQLSDEELLAQLADTVRKEKALVDRWTASGDCFIISGSGKVHLPTCSSVSAVVDRQAAWAPFLDDLDRVRAWHGTDNEPPMPALMTRADVEELTRYSSCPECSPTLDHRDKRPSARGWTTLEAGNLNFRHFGIPFSLVEGAEIGVLTKLSRVETADGLDFAAEFDGIVDPVTDPLTEVMYRTDFGPQMS